MMIKGILLAVAVFAGVVAAATSFTKASAEPGNQITILYDAFGTDPAMTKDWGFSALVEIAGKRILFDTGANAEIFAANVKAKGVDLTELDFVVLSHRHSDHMAGLNYVLSVNPTVRIYAPKEGFGIYGSSLPSSFYRKDDSLLPEMRYYDGKPPEVMKFGAAWANAHFELIDQTTEIAPGITLIALISDLPGMWVTNGPAGLEIRLPFYPRDRTSPTRPAMSVSCHFRTHAPQQGGLTRSPRRRSQAMTVGSSRRSPWRF